MKKSFNETVKSEAKIKSNSELEHLKEDIERVISRCVVERVVKNSLDGKGLDAIYVEAEKAIDNWKVHNTYLEIQEEENEADEYIFTFEAERLGLIIGRMGEQIDVFGQAIEKELKIRVLFNLKEVKRSNLYSSMDGYYLLKSLADSEEDGFGF